MVRKMKKRICLVLDCLCAHDFSDKTADLINLQHYVIKEKRLSERETVVIFYDVVRVVEALHKVRSLLSLSVLEDFSHISIIDVLKLPCAGSGKVAEHGCFSCFPVTVFCIRPHAASHKRVFPSPPLKFLNGKVALVDCGEGPAGLNADQVNYLTSERGG